MNGLRRKVHFVGVGGIGMSGLAEILLNLGYEVYLVEELLFSASRNVGAAITRMKAAGAVFLTYKSLYYELVGSVESGTLAEKRLQKFGPLPDDLPDAAME